MKSLQHSNHCFPSRNHQFHQNISHPRHSKGQQPRLWFLIGILAVALMSPGQLSAQFTWTRYFGNPILSRSNIIGLDVHQNAGGDYVMYFTQPWKTYRSVSQNGLTWTMPSEAPIFSPGGGSTSSPRVIYDGTGYKMYYANLNAQICLATSSDGLSWTPRDTPVLTGTPGTFDGDGMLHHCVYYDGNTYYLWYTGMTNKLGLAKSLDGINWVKSSSNPIMVSSGAAWDLTGLDSPTIFKVGSVYHMLYLGANSARQLAVGYASSYDGEHWTTGNHNPVFTADGSGWEANSIGGLSVIVKNDSIKLWYIGEAVQGGTWQVGFASSPWLGGSASDGQFVTSLTVTPHSGASKLLTFGAKVGATDSIDTDLGEEELPPVPPAENFDARWVIAGTNGTMENYKDTLPDAGSMNSYVGTVQAGASGYPVTLSWSRANLHSPGTFYLQDAATHGSSYKIDMASVGQFQIQADSVLPFEIVYSSQQSMSVPVVGFWNLISVPMVVTDPTATTVFSGSTSHPYAYNLTYVSAESVSHGVGYWVKYPTAATAVFHGTPVMGDTIAVHAGWNLIGSVATAIDTEAVHSIPSGIIVSRYFGYDEGYLKTRSIMPGAAYWVKSNAEGVLILGGPGASPSHTSANANKRRATSKTKIIENANTGK